MSAPLSERERRFVRALTGDACGNITKAALAAGCSEKSAARIGYRLSKRVHVQEAIAKVHHSIDAASHLTAAQVERELDAIITSAPERKPTYAEKLKAIELKGKRLKMWDDPSKGAGVVVNIGFLAQTVQHASATSQAADVIVADVTNVVMPSCAQVDPSHS